MENKLKILHIIPNLKTGGAERLVVDICTEIYNKNLANIKLITFHEKVQSELPFHKNIYSYFLPSISQKSKIYTKKLQKFIDEYQSDIIHTHLWESEMLFTQINIGSSLRFSHFHDNMKQLAKKIPFKKEEFTDKFEKRIYLENNQNSFICISKDTFIYAKKVLPKCLHKKIYLIPNGINLNKFYCDKKRELNDINLINVGSFIKKKNQIFAVRILKELIDKGFNARLIFLGDGLMKDKVLNLAKKFQIEKNIEFKGNVENVEYYLKKSNIFLHTANYEPFGLVILEAMASGLPVVTLDGGGNCDFIKHGENGYIFKKEDEQNFSNIITELFRNKILFDHIAKNGQKTSRSYDINKYTKKLIKIYKESISSTN